MHLFHFFFTLPSPVCLRLPIPLLGPQSSIIFAIFLAFFLGIFTFIPLIRGIKSVVLRNNCPVLDSCAFNSIITSVTLIPELHHRLHVQTRRRRLRPCGSRKAPIEAASKSNFHRQLRCRIRTFAIKNRDVVPVLPGLLSVAPSEKLRTTPRLPTTRLPSAALNLIPIVLISFQNLANNFYLSIPESMIEITLTFSRSSGSTSYQHLPDDDRIYLPDSNVYITTTSSGRPAIARKKNSDHGFDFLSEAFGIPTRPSFQRGRRQSIPNPQPRSKSAYSTPTPRVIELPSDYEESPERNELERSPGQGSSRSSSRSNSKLKSIVRTPTSNANTPRQLRDYSPSSSRVSLKSKRRSHTLSHPPEPERTRFAVYDDEPDENDSIADSTVPLVYPNGSDYSPLASSQFHPSFSTLPAGFQQFPSQAPPMMWSSTGAVGHVPAPLGATNNLAGNMSPQQAQSSGYQMPYTHVMGFQQPNNTHHIPHMPQMGTPAFTQPQQGFVIPPPPPPLFVSHSDSFAPLAQSSSLVQPDEGQTQQHCETNDKAQLTKDEASRSGHHSQENRSDESRNEGVKSSKKKKQSAKDGMDQTPPSTPTMHMHICAGCGKTRSKGYHMTHPLKKGEIPEPDYCRRCIMTADYTDSEVTESGVGSDFLMVGVSHSCFDE